MRILIAPDSFKGSLSARAAAEAMARGVRRARPDARIGLLPLSDGGEGFLDALVPPEAQRTVRVLGPMGDPVEAQWGFLPGSRTAVLESARVIGLGKLPTADRAPTDTTTYGVGELLREALDAGARAIRIGLGGTATTDGGAGMAQAIGLTLAGLDVPARGGDLSRLRAIGRAGRDARFERLDLIALTDVDNPLAGPDGAARIYGPQKGADANQVRELDAALLHLAACAGDAGRQPGDGAAGGLGYGLRVFAGAELASGIEYVLDALHFDAHVDRADWVITGEGRLDTQSARGKVIAGVTSRCRVRGIPVIALVGAVGEGADAILGAGLSAYYSLSGADVSERRACEQAEALLENLASDVLQGRVAF